MTVPFLLLFATVAGAVAFGLFRFLKPKAPHVLGILLVWLAMDGGVAWSGFFADCSRRPPGILFALIPMLGALAFVARSSWGKSAAALLPLTALLGLQVFRLPLELILHGLWREGLLPKMMTYEGANFDIVMGASAPIMAWLAHKNRLPRPTNLLWNVLGTVMVINVALRGVLTSPALRVLSSEQPNTAVVQFPYIFIAVFLVPLALTLHILALRKVASRGA